MPVVSGTMEIVLSDKAATIAGTILKEGKPRDGVFAIVARWPLAEATDGRLNALDLRSAKVDADGSFRYFQRSVPQPIAWPASVWRLAAKQLVFRPGVARCGPNSHAGGKRIEVGDPRFERTLRDPSTVMMWGGPPGPRGALLQLRRPKRRPEVRAGPETRPTPKGCHKPKGGRPPSHLQ